MAYTMIEGYLCDRCGYRWAPRNGTGIRDRKDPKVCAHCKSPYWNRARKNKFPKDRWADRWTPEGEQDSGAEPTGIPVAGDSD